VLTPVFITRRCTASIAPASVVLILATTVIGPGIGIAAGTVAATTTSATQVGTTYYVDNSTTQCSDGNAGTSASAPWCDFKVLNSRASLHQLFQPGDQILLKAGDTWQLNTHIELSGSGTSAHNIAFGSYGNGAKPSLIGSKTSYFPIVDGTNLDYWTVNGIQISESEGPGILIQYTTTGHHGLTFSNNYIHNIGNANGQVWSIVISGSSILEPGCPLTYNPQCGPAGPMTPIVDGASFTNNVVDAAFPPTLQAPNNFMDPIHSKCLALPCHNAINTWTNVNYENNYFYDYGDAAGGGLSLRDETQVRFISNRIEDCGRVYAVHGTTCLFEWNDSYIVVANNSFYHIPQSYNSHGVSSTDETFIDEEAYDRNATYQNNYFADAAGAPIEFLLIAGDGSSPINNTLSGQSVTGNVFVGNEVGVWAGPQGNLRGDLWYINQGEAVRASQFYGRATNNIRSEATTGFVDEASYFHLWTITNTTNIPNAGEIFNGGQGFLSGNSTWSYQLQEGSGFVQLSCGTPCQKWGSVNAYVAQLDEQADSSANDWISRTWTAPSNGTVVVRGHVMQLDPPGGVGANVRITRNGVVLWSANDATKASGAGVDANLNSLVVQKGDVLRFEVSSGGSSAIGPTSWEPTVAYIG